MKNLENYDVQELNAKEIRETDGGISPVWEWIVDEVVAWIEDGGPEELVNDLSEDYRGTTTQYGLYIGS